MKYSMLYHTRNGNNFQTDFAWIEDAKMFIDENKDIIIWAAVVNTPTGEIVYHYK